jgi:hypothetical protein
LLALKKKSILNYYKKNVASYTTITRLQEQNKIKTILVLVREERVNELRENLLGQFEFTADEMVFLVWCAWDKKREYQKEEFTTKDIGFFGKIKNQNLQHQLAKEYDLLITYNAPNDIVMNLLTLVSKATFKAGLSSQDQRLNDLVIAVEENDPDAFKNELIKYLKILKKI